MDPNQHSNIQIPDWTGKTILIVEDVETNMLFFKAALARTGANLLWAMDGFESIDMCKKDPGISLVLMDLRMPNLDGFQATEAIKAFRPDLPVIAQTTYTDDVDTGRLYRSGCDDYLPKPIRLEDLLNSIGKFLNPIQST
jgi:two-component system, cell cycle response regulator DivK